MGRVTPLQSRMPGIYAQRQKREHDRRIALSTLRRMKHQMNVAAGAESLDLEQGESHTLLDWQAPINAIIHNAKIDTETIVGAALVEIYHNGEQVLSTPLTQGMVSMQGKTAKVAEGDSIIVTIYNAGSTLTLKNVRMSFNLVPTNA